MKTVEDNKVNREKDANDSLICRNIVQEILKFGVSQQQVLRLLYYLSLELENRETMLDISSIIRGYIPSLAQEKESNIVLK